ncbi:MAG: hypothetical protein Q9159_006095 [Coniocarpon cinnabarinum]
MSVFTYDDFIHIVEFALSVRLTLSEKAYLEKHSYSHGLFELDSLKFRSPPDVDCERAGEHFYTSQSDAGENALPSLQLPAGSTARHLIESKHAIISPKDQTGSRTEQTLMCPMCQEYFPSKSSLDTHALNHIGPKPVALQNDSKVFLTMLQSLPENALHVTSSTQQPLLHMACEMGDLPKTRILLENGANPNALDGCGWTPIHIAVRQLNLAMIGLLRDYEAHIDTIDGKSFNAVWLLLAGRILENKAHEVSRIISILQALAQDPRGLSLIQHTFHSYTLLHVAANSSNLTLAQYLLDIGVSVKAKAQEHAEQTALHIAADIGNKEMIALLISRGANVLAKDAMGRTPCHCASSWMAVNQLLYSPSRTGRSLGHQTESSVHSFSKYTMSTVKDGLGRDPIKAMVARGATTAAETSLTILRLWKKVDSLRNWNEISSFYQVDKDNLDEEHFCTEQSVFYLPYNISTSMTKVLLEFSVIPGVSIRARPPLESRLARLGEAQSDTKVKGDRATIVSPEPTSSLDGTTVPSSRLHSMKQLDLDSEENIREQRIEAEEWAEGVRDAYAQTSKSGSDTLRGLTEHNLDLLNRQNLLPRLGSRQGTSKTFCDG